MSPLLFFTVASALAIFVWHLVRPNVRDLRISMARFLPDLQPSQSPRFRISPVPPMTSLPFLLRMLLLALVTLAIWPQLLPQVQSGLQGPHLRIVLDRSPSNRIANREALSFEAVARLMVHAGLLADFCVDLIAVDGVAEFLVRGDPAVALANAQHSSAGMAAHALLRPLIRPVSGGCPGVPTHAAIVSDLPPQPVPAEAFGGPLVWWQVGEPVANLAISDLRVTGGGLSGAAPRVEVLVQGFGWTSSAPRAEIGTGAARREVALLPDPQRENGWIAALPFPGEGRHVVALAGEDGFAGDNRLRFTLRAVERLAVDWTLPTPPRPPSLLAGGASDLLVGPLDQSAPVPADRPIVLVYPATYGTGAAQIGYFRQRHPVLEGVNFDVLEPVLPGGLVELPTGFVPVLRRDGPGAPVVVAVRASPRGVIVPAPHLGGQASEVSLVLFANALRWASGEIAGQSLYPQYLDGQGGTIPGALLESDTARLLAPPPDLARLAEPSAAVPPPENTGLTVWLLIAALLVFLVERAVGVIWRVAR